MMLDRFFKLKRREEKPLPELQVNTLQIGTRSVPLLMVHHSRARRYLLRLREDGIVRVTIPQRGNVSAARDFACRNVAWLEQQFQRLAARPQIPPAWQVGAELLLRGEAVRIETDADGHVRFGAERLQVPAATADLRSVIQTHLHRLAARELPPRVLALAALHGISVSRVSVRNQKTRWGSCSRRGTISLNWRLIQSPAFVRDYIILHELAHRRQMNHSERFWQEVARLCPEYPTAERWLKQHAKLLR